MWSKSKGFAIHFHLRFVFSIAKEQEKKIFVMVGDEEGGTVSHTTGDQKKLHKLNELVVSEK